MYFVFIFQPISKKKKELLEEQRIKFVEGAKRLNNDPAIADKLVDLINHFAQYGFNKSHSAAYAMISYQTAYLKANYPVEFMAALLSIRMGSQEKVSQYIISYCRGHIHIAENVYHVSSRIIHLAYAALYGAYA